MNNNNTPRYTNAQIAAIIFTDPQAGLNAMAVLSEHVIWEDLCRGN